MKETKKMAGNRVVTGERTRWSYCNVLQPREDDNGKMKYSVSLIIPKDDTETVEAIRQAIKYAYNAVLRFPTCIRPVGLGANLVLTLLIISFPLFYLLSSSIY